MEEGLRRQLRFLHAATALLAICVALLTLNTFHPFRRLQHFGVIEAEQLNIRENNGTLKAVLSGSAGFNEGDRAKDAPPRFSGLMFYNEEGAEEGGLVYQGRAIPGGQDADVSLTMDQYRQDQDVYLNHTEHKDAKGLSISDGLQINSRPDWTQEKQEYAIYRQIGALPESQQKDARLEALRRGEIGTKRLFYGVKRGTADGQSFDDAGLFIKNRLGRDAIKLYVDVDNKPHFEVLDELGNTKVYELKLGR